MRSRIGLILLMVLSTAVPAQADRGDLSAAVVAAPKIILQSGKPAATGAMLLALAEWGLSDMSALRLEAGLSHGGPGGRLSGDVGGGLVLLWDVLAWVPVVSLSAGVRALGDSPPTLRYGGTLEVRRTLTTPWWLGLSMGLQRLANLWEARVGLICYRQF